MIHVLPIDDLEPHIESELCECGPRIMWRDEDTGEEFDVPIVVHNAFDGRE